MDEEQGFLIDILAGVPKYKPEPEFLYEYDTDPIPVKIAKQIQNGATSADIERLILDMHSALFSDMPGLRVTELFNSAIFLHALDSASLGMEFDMLEKVSINFNLLDFTMMNDNTNLVDYAYSIGKRINNAMYKCLLSELSENNAIKLAMAINSSLDLSKIPRCNYILIHDCKEIKDIQSMENIFGYIYRNIPFSEVFIHVLCGVPYLNISNKDEEKRYQWMHEVTLAIVDLGMTTGEIDSIVRNFKAYVQSSMSGSNVFLHLNDLDKYPRLRSAYIEILQGGRNIW